MCSALIVRLMPHKLKGRFNRMEKSNKDTDLKPPIADHSSAAKHETTTNLASKKQQNPVLPIVVLAVYLVMIGINALANLLPLNGISTGAVSDSYKNLFAPAGITFAVWGLIYFLLAIFVLFQFIKPATAEAEGRLKLTRGYFILSSIANAAWIFCWHYRLLPLSLVLMVIILVSLIIIQSRLTRDTLGFREKALLRLPFSVYFGWITVATVANATTLLVSLGWTGSGIGEPVWTAAILIIATLITLAVIGRTRDWAYGATVAWAFAGILIKHLDPDPAKGFNGQYLIVIITVSICLGFIAATALLALAGRKIKLMPFAKSALGPES